MAAALFLCDALENNATPVGALCRLQCQCTESHCLRNSGRRHRWTNDRRDRTGHGTKNIVVTDIDGNFTLKNVAKNATLVVSYIGYKTEKIAVDGQTNIRVVLSEDSESLDEVVVIGYGGTRARRDSQALSAQFQALNSPQSPSTSARSRPSG